MIRDSSQIGYLWTDDDIVSILKARGYDVIKTTESLERSWLNETEEVEVQHVVKDGVNLTDHWHYAGQYYFTRVERFFFKEIFKPALNKLMIS